MVISIDKKNFIDAVHKTSRFAQRGSATLPVLSCILIVSGDDGIKFRATNLEVGIDFKVSGTNKKHGVVAIPANILQQIAGSLSGDGSITIEQSGDTVVITSGPAHSVVKTIAYEDFPSLPTTQQTKNNTFNIDGEVFKNSLNTVVSCASTSTVRPDISSILLSNEGGVLTTVATDVFRLARKKQTLSKTIPNISILLPAKNSIDIIQTLPDKKITVIIDEHQISCLWDGSTLTSRLTTGTYPDYKSIIPKETIATATILKKDLESALRRVSIFSDSFQKIHMVFDHKKQQLKLTSRNAELGESEERLSATVSGEMIEQSFNYRYIQTPLQLITTESIKLTATGVGRPLLVCGVGDESFLYLVMPMNQ